MGEINPINVYSSQLPADTLFQSNALSVSNKTFDSTNTVSSVSSLPSTVVNTTQSNVVTDAMLVAATYTKITITNKAKLPSDICYLNDSQTITNHIIDASNDISGALGAAGVALLASANVFTNSQTIQKDAQDQFTFYRPVNTLGAKQSLRFDFNNSTGSRFNDGASIVIELLDNVAASYDTAFEVYNSVAGAKTEVFAIDSSTVTTSPTWGVTQVFANDTPISMKSAGGTNLQCMKMDAGDNLVIGTTLSTLTDIFFFSGNASAALVISNSNTVTTSPIWGVPIGLNNNLNYLMKDSGGTFRQLMKLNSANTLIVGDSAGITAVSIFGGAGSEALGFNSINQATFTKLAQAGVAETLMTVKVSDDASVFDIRNASAVDTQFAPWIIGSLSTNHTTTTSALRFSGYIPTAQDSGTVAAVRIDASLQSGGALATRPILDVFNVNTSVFKINAKGDVTHSILTQAGVAEVLYKWTGPADSDANSFFQIMNYTSLDANYATKLVASTSLAASNGPALGIWGWVTPAADSASSTPVINIDIRRTDATEVVNRPALTISNLNTVITKIDAIGRFSFVVQDAGTEENLLDATLSDATGSYWRVSNAGGGVASLFLPRIWGHNAQGANTFAGQYIYSSVPAAQDSGLTPLLILDGRLDASTAVTNRPLLGVRNASSINYFQVGAKGQVSINAGALAGAAEVILKLQVSDNATAYIQFQNGSAVDAIFTPRMVTYNFNAGSALYGFNLTSYISAADDTGTAAIQVYDVRRSTEAAITSRNCYEWRNFGVALITLSSLIADFHGLEIANAVYDVSNSGFGYFPSVGRKWGIWIPSLASPKGLGLLEQLTYSGTQTFGNDTTDGTWLRFDTTSTINTPAGLRSNTSLTHRTMNMRWNTKFRLEQLTDVKMYLGIRTGSVMPTSDDPFNAAVGMSFGYSSTIGANWLIFKNDAVGVTVVIDTGIAADTNVHTIEIKSTSTKFTYSLDGAAPVDVTGDIPNSFLGIGASISNSLGVAKTFQLMHMEMESDK